ncbi:MAG: sensor domain-containing diguanylate cyclase [Actinomycetota bacterium]
MKTLRQRRRMPLHVRFARGYQAGLVVALVVSVLVWNSVEQGLDEVAASEDAARDVTTLVLELHRTGALMDEVEADPMSLSLRSDVVRQSERLGQTWQTVLGHDLPESVDAQLFGRLGSADVINSLITDTAALGAMGADGSSALDPAFDRSEAARLQARSIESAAQMTTVIGVFEAEADTVIAAMRSNNLLTVSISLVFLLLLVVVLLRPLRRLMETESKMLSNANAVHREESERQELASHLADGLEAAESEEETHRVVERAFSRLMPDASIELLLAEGVKGDLASAVTHPVNGGPGCGVESPWACPAVRRGRTMTYEDSRSINACPHLAERSDGPCSAACVPLSFMGESMGVMHTTGAVNESVDAARIDVLGLVASQVAVRIGTLRSFAQVELQASTDTLTGLPNRRATEDRMQRLLVDHEVVSIAMADLDRFKQLNDKYGHEAGDRALRIFTDAVRSALRDEDVIGRWGGEEFVIVLPGMSAGQAKKALDRVRDHLADACSRAEAPAVTVSMGVVDSEQSTIGDELVRLADEALLAAKTQGRDRVLVGPVVAGVDEAMAAATDGADA